MNERTRRLMLRWRTLLVVSVGYFGPASTAIAQDSAKIEANSHFEKGVAAFRVKRFAEAVSEFELAYKIAPAFQVLYNIGAVHAALGRHAEAVQALTSYLAEGGASIPPSRRADVMAELEKEREFVGTLTVRVAPDGASILVDRALLRKSPMTPLFVASGTHQVQVSLAGYAPELRDIDVAPRADVVVDLTLQPVTSEVLESSDRNPEGQDQRGSDDSARRKAAYVVGASGLASVVTGTVLAATGASHANSAWDELHDATTPAAWDAAKEDYDAGKTRNVVGLVLIGLGVAGLGTGAYLFATSSGRRTAIHVQVVPKVSSQTNGFDVVGSW